MKPGDHVGPYEILAPLGAGGMGEVYRARDSKLKREVALKVLPDLFAGDPERMARFQREAELLAALNHPYIAAIYGLEGNALVMELVEGENLGGPLPIETAIACARQIAEALEYAHEKGIIHRDLKPGNVKITPEGVVKVLDFGLAKAIEDPGPASDPASSPTLTLGATRAGVIMGTAAYMSPEQASGKTADRRSDIWSFGAVLYEMLAGKRAFAGESVSDTLATVLKLDPDWDALPAATPASIRKLVRRCLTKDRRQRLQAIGEARIALENPERDEPAKATSGVGHRFLWPAATALCAVVACAALWGWLRSAPVEPRAVLRVTTTLPMLPGRTPPFVAISHDGSRLAFVGREHQIYLRMMDQFEARPIPGTEGSASCCLAFSPDGQWISYISGGSPNLRLMKVAVSGGPPQTLTDLKATSGQTWGPDGNILFTTNEAGLVRISSSGGTPEILAAPDTQRGERSYYSPRLVPGGQDVLVAVRGSGTAPVYQIAAINLQTRARKILLEAGGNYAQYLPSNPGSPHGHIVYLDLGSRRLMAVPFDIKRSKAEGSPAPVLDDLLGIQFTISDSGTLAYVPSGTGPGSLSTLVWVDRTGAEQALPAPPRAFSAFQLSPDGEHIAFEIEGDRSNDLWNYDIARGTFARLTTEGNNIGPVWTPDGKRLIYSFTGPQNWELRSLAADNSGSPSVLWSGGDPYRTSTVSPDGKTLVVHLDSRANGTTFFTLSLGDVPSHDSKPQPFLRSGFSMDDLQFSPDGRYVSYQSTESGRPEIYVAPYPGPGGRLPISTRGGLATRWSRSGRELFYRSPEGMMVVDIQTTPAVRVGKPKALFEKRNDAPGFDLAPDGRRFLMLKSQAAEEGSTVQLNLVVNWFEELRRRVPVGK